MPVRSLVRRDFEPMTVTRQAIRLSQKLQDLATSSAPRVPQYRPALLASLVPAPASATDRAHSWLWSSSVDARVTCYNWHPAHQVLGRCDYERRRMDDQCHRWLLQTESTVIPVSYRRQPESHNAKVLEIEPHSKLIDPFELCVPAQIPQALNFQAVVNSTSYL